MCVSSCELQAVTRVVLLQTVRSHFTLDILKPPASQNCAFLLVTVQNDAQAESGHSHSLLKLSVCSALTETPILRGRDTSMRCDVTNRLKPTLIQSAYTSGRWK